MILPTQEQVKALYEENVKSHEHCNPNDCSDRKCVERITRMLAQTREYHALLEIFAAEPATNPAELASDFAYVMARGFYMGLQMGLKLAGQPVLAEQPERVM